MTERDWHLSVKRLSSGYYFVRGDGICNWAQPPHWPCDQKTLRAHAFHEAAEEFLRAVIERYGLEAVEEYGENEARNESEAEA